MQLADAILLSIPFLSLVSCAETRLVATLENISTEKMCTAHITKISDLKSQSFEFRVGPEPNVQRFFIRTDRVPGTKLVMQRDRMIQVIQFPQRITTSKTYSFYRDRLGRTDYMWAPLSSELPGKKTSKKYIALSNDDQDTPLPDEKIDVVDGDMVVALIPMSSDTNKDPKKKTKCRPAKIAETYEKSKESSTGARFDEAISKNCKDGTVVPIVIQYRIEKDNDRSNLWRSL